MGGAKHSFGSIRFFFVSGSRKIEKIGGDHSDGLIHRLIEVRTHVDELKMPMEWWLFKGAMI